MSPKAGLIAAALSAQLGVEIKSEQQATANQLRGSVPLLPLKISSIFRHLYDEVKSDDTVTLRVLHRDDLKFQVDPYKTVEDIKKSLGAQVGLHPGSQVLLYGGRPLANGSSLVAQNLLPGSSCLLQWGPSGDGPAPTHYIKDEDLAPEFDYDFTNITDDGQTFERGGYEYERPCGWDRCALAVLGRYSSDVWLGPNGIRTGSAPGEWAVSYHGTGVGNIGSIADGGYDPGRSKRQMYGEGIYSSPSIHVAEEEQYAKTFSYEGKQYKVVLQNRVNLANTVVEPISAGKVYFITKDPDNIRPYGVCLKEVK